MVTTRAEYSEGHGGEVSANQQDIGEAGPLTPRHAAGGIANELVMLPRVATTPKSKGKSKGKAREEEEEEEIKELIEDLFTNKHLANLLQWRKVLMVVDTDMCTGVVLKRAKGKSTVSPEERQAFKKCQGACDNC
ncbi:hypothetical protein E4T56_gene11504 [Termitomyces sp. T112]|nr:hypothetical protein E4T56_gene11504 [Termitomyces sp. T112]